MTAIRSSTDSDDNLFISRLKLAMSRNGISQSDLARSMGVSRNTIYKYVNGIFKTPRTDTLQKFSEILDVPIEFFTRDDFDVETMRVSSVIKKEAELLESLKETVKLQSDMINMLKEKLSKYE